MYLHIQGFSTNLFDVGEVNTTLSMYILPEIILYSFTFLLGKDETLVNKFENNHSGAFGKTLVHISY